MSHMYDVIIPHLPLRETNDLAVRCLESIREYSDIRHVRVIFVMNCSEPPSRRLQQELNHFDHCVLFNPQKRGFAATINVGLKQADASYIIFMNNDTEAAHQWLEKLERPLHAPDVGMTGPLTTATDCWQGNPGSRQYPRGSLLLPKTSMLAFFCTMIRHDVIEAVGYLDEDFDKAVGSDDDDYCHRVHKAGYDIVLVTSLVIPHRHRTTFRALYDEDEIIRKRNEALALFYKKTGLPRPVPRKGTK